MQTARLGDAWWKSAVVYQIYPKSFADSDGDGVGDLNGIRAHLPYLQDLGVDVLWLSPVYPSPQDDNGYDISDYRGIDPVFGTLADFDALLAEVHERHMRLIMDLVVNHTSDEHPWFVESRDPASPKRDWYWWRPARPGMRAGEPGAEPNNWGSWFGGSAWQLDPRSGEYYLHLFSRKQVDLNWENPEVREAVYDVMRWWLDRGVDGFRMDVINMIAKDPALPDGAVHPSNSRDGMPHFADGERVHRYLQELHREVMAPRTEHVMTVGETPGVNVEQARLFTDPARAEIDMVFQFEHMDVDHGESRFDVRPLWLPDLKASLARWQTGLDATGWNTLYWSNHDQARAVSRFGDDGRYRRESATALATVLHLHRGTPFVYQGEELGATNAPFASVGDFRDIESLNYYAGEVAAGGSPEELLDRLRARGRDNARTPMHWDDSPNAGFTTGTPWLAVNPNYREINAAAELVDPGSVLHYYRRLIALRKQEAAIVHGRFELLLPDDETVYAFERRLGATALLVLANFSSEPAHADAWADAELLIGNYGDPPPDPAALRPWEAVVYRRA
ncbi:MAG TPA: alpha-glucosidase [Gaiellaceae bacterium]|nr:alpha-glucosidase [Gaiellaceae bacterium]